MEIQPATLTQVSRARNGQMVVVDDDVQNVVRDLHSIDPHFRVRWSEAGEYFVVYYHPQDEPEGNGYVVLTAQELDQRVVKRVMEISNEAYDYAAELDKADKAADEKRDYEFSQTIGEVGERLAHAMRKELGYTNARATIPKDIPSE